MKKEFVACIGIGLLVCLLPASLWAWCWIRDTGLTDANCDEGSYQQDCCDGELRKWLDGSMTYRISEVTDASLISLIETGMSKWNDVEMSLFAFNRGANTTTAVFNDSDEENTIIIDPSFCDNFEEYLGDACSMVLGISGTRVSESGYQALESDIALNDQSFDWDDGTNHHNTVAIIAHEAGHSAGLTHPGDACRSSGSSGCGAEFPEATMYYAYDVSTISDEPNIDKTTLELDEVAALVYGYPRSTLRAHVLNTNSDPIIGAEVELLDSAAPVDGSSIAEGGSVYGDVTNSDVLFGEKSSSSTYIPDTPFNDTNADGETNFINPIHENLRVKVTAGSCTPVTQSHTVVAGTNTVDVTINTTETDFAGPTVTVTSHTNGQAVGTANITLAGTATDSGRGGNGVSQVTVNGEAADNSTAVDAGEADWSTNITLDEGGNTLTVIAYDDKSPGEKNSSTLTFLITYDTIPPTVSAVSPDNGSIDVPISTNFGVKFSEAMNSTSINTSTFRVDNGVTGTITYNASTYTAIFVPSAPLAHNTVYTATLTTGIQDSVELPMAADYTWSITTIAASGGSGGGGGGICFIDTATAR